MQGALYGFRLKSHQFTLLGYFKVTDERNAPYKLQIASKRQALISSFTIITCG